MEDRKKSLIEMISKAFAHAQYPGDTRIVSPYEGVCRDLEREDIERAFRGLRWQDIDFNFLCPRHSGDLGFFTPEAFVYYLPAFMITAITDLEAADVLTDSIVYKLQVRTFRGSPFQEASKSMTTEQLSTILAFLDYLRSEGWGEGADDRDLAEAEQSVQLAMRKV